MSLAKNGPSRFCFVSFSFFLREERRNPGRETKKEKHCQFNNKMREQNAFSLLRFFIHLTLGVPDMGRDSCHSSGAGS